MSFLNRVIRKSSTPANNAGPVAGHRQRKARPMAEALEPRTMFGGGIWTDPGVAAPTMPVFPVYSGGGSTGGRNWGG